MEGWVKFHREWLNNPIITKDSEYLAVWVYLLTYATHTEKEAYFYGKKITLLPGQLLITHKDIYESYNIEPSKLRRIFKSLKNDCLIDYQTDKHKTLITLAKWEVYQGLIDYPNDDVMTIKRLSEQETEKEKEKRSKREKVKEKEINKNDKNVRKNNPLYPPIGEGDELFSLFWTNYPKKIGKGYAKRCFNKIKPTRELVNTMIEAIKAQKRSDMWKRDNGQYIPNPSTWLNQQRWLDCLEIEIEDDNPWKKFDLGITL